MSGFEPVAFGTSFEALVVGVLTPMPPGGVERLKAVGFDPTRPVQVAYSAKVWMETLLVAGELRFPGLSVDEASQRLGELYIRGFSTTLMGRAVFALGHAIGIDRMLPRMTRNFRNANNFIDTEVVKLGPGAWKATLTTHPDARAIMTGRARQSASFTQGVMRGILVLHDYPQVEVTLTECDEALASSTLLLRFGAG